MKTSHILALIAAAAMGLAASCGGSADKVETSDEETAPGCGCGDGCSCGDMCSCTLEHRCSDGCSCNRYVEPGMITVARLEPLSVEDFKADADAKTYSFVIKPATAPKGKLKYFLTDYSTGARRAVEAENGLFKDVSPASKPAYVYVVTVYDMVDGAVADSASVDVAGVEEFPEKLSSRPSVADIKAVIDGVLNSGDITKLTDSPLCVTDPAVSLASDPNVKRLSDLIDIYTLGGFSEYTIQAMDFDDTNRVCNLTISVK